MRKLFCFSAAFAAAVFALGYGAAPLALLALPLALWKKEDRRLRALLVCLGLAAGLLWCRGYDAFFRAPARALEHTRGQMSATVEDWPRETSLGIAVRVRLDTGRWPGVLMTLYADGRYLSLIPGDRVTGRVEFRPSDDVGGSYTDYDVSRGIFLRASASGAVLETIRPDRVPLRLWPALWARTLKTSIDAVFSPEAAPLVKAVVTGDRTDLPGALYADLKTSGLSHTTAVSGLHVAFLAGLAVQLFGRRRRTALAVIPLLVAFALAVGATPSVNRAVVMQVLLLTAPLAGRENDPPTSLSLALLLLLVQNPYAARSVSLQLSFAAVAGIQVFSNPIHRRIWAAVALKNAKKGPRRWANALMNYLVSCFSTTCGALVFTTPLLAYYFGSVSLIAPLSNLLCLWVVSWVFILGLTAAVLGAAWLPLGTLLALAAEPAVGYVLWLVPALGRAPFAAVRVDSPYILAALVFCYGILILCLASRYRRPILPVCACVTALCAAVLMTRGAYELGPMTVTALDVGRGQSVLIRAGERTALVDCGGSEGNAGDLCADYLRSRGREHLDLLILTHFHADHANGVPELFQRLDVAVLAVPDVEPDDPLRREILDLAAEHGVQVWFIRDDQRLPFGPAELTLYAPLGAGEANEEGVSVLWQTGEFSALLTGDMGHDIERRLVKYGALPDVDLLVAGHHGAKTATSQALLDAVTPEAIVFSVGVNSYGHPDPDTLLRVDGMGCDSYRTDLQGNITITVG